jgi:hypothetical protein
VPSSAKQRTHGRFGLKSAQLHAPKLQLWPRGPRGARGASCFGRHVLPFQAPSAVAVTTIQAVYATSGDEQGAALHAGPRRLMDPREAYI